MTDCIDRDYRYRSFDYSIKLSRPFSVLEIFTFFTIVFKKKLDVFSSPWQNTAKISRFFKTLVLTDDSITSMKMRPKVLIDTIGIDPLIRHRLCPSTVWALRTDIQYCLPHDSTCTRPREALKLTIGQCRPIITSEPRRVLRWSAEWCC